MAFSPIPELALVFLLVFVINLAPAFMPATWIVLVVLREELKLPVVGLTIVGAIASTLGRVGLAWLTRRFGARFIPRRIRNNLAAISELLNQHPGWSFVSVLGLTTAPVPSNELFIAVGLARLNLRPVAAAFFLTRLGSYAIGLLAAGRASQTLRDLFTTRLNTGPGLLVELVSLAPAVIFLFIPWARVLDWFRQRFRSS